MITPLAAHDVHLQSCHVNGLINWMRLGLSKDLTEDCVTDNSGRQTYGVGDRETRASVHCKLVFTSKPLFT